MTRSAPALLVLLAAVVMAIAPVLALAGGVTEPLSLVAAGVVLIAAILVWQGVSWARWLVVVLAVGVLWRTLRAIRFGWMLSDRVPHFLLWRSTRLVAGLSLVVAAVLLWRDRSSGGQRG